MCGAIAPSPYRDTRKSKRRDEVMTNGNGSAVNKSTFSPSPADRAHSHASGVATRLFAGLFYKNDVHIGVLMAAGVTVRP
jgi:hypothetical protein